MYPYDFGPDVIRTEADRLAADYLTTEPEGTEADALAYYEANADGMFNYFDFIDAIERRTGTAGNVFDPSDFDDFDGLAPDQPGL